MKEIFHRTSIRKYEKKKVEEDKIRRLLRAAMAAPSARNQQPWEFYVVTAKDNLGLGAVWLGIAPLEDRMKAVGKVLEISENLYAFSMIACGYPAEEKTQQDRYDETRIHCVD